MAEEYISKEEALSAITQADLQNSSVFVAGEAKQKIRDIPAANVAPVVPGRWDVGGVCPWNGVVGNWKCSACGGVSLKKSAYCPNCGAKMDLEVDHA